MGVDNPEQQMKETKEEINNKDSTTKSETDTIPNTLLTDTTTTPTPVTQTTTLSDEEIRKILKDWMNGKGGWNNTIIDEDMDPKYTKNLGNNRWQYEDEEGKKYTFEFDPTNKTFKEL